MLSPRPKRGIESTEVHLRILARHHRTDEGCRIWEGALNPDGYGVVKISKLLGTGLVHRVMWIWANSRNVKPGFTLDHICHTLSNDCEGGVTCIHRSCFEPSHLEEVPRVDNWQRAANRRRERAEAGR